MRSGIVVGACAVLACAALLGSSGAAFAQAPKAAPPGGMQAAPGGMQKKPLPRAKDDRWTRLLNAAGVMAREGMEVGRISAAERKQIEDYVVSLQRFIATARQGGISEAEEDQVDNGVASMFRQIAAYMAG